MDADFVLVVIAVNSINCLLQKNVVHDADISSMIFPVAGSIQAGYVVFSGFH